MLPPKTSKLLESWIGSAVQSAKAEISASPKAAAMVKAWGALGKSGASLETVDDLIFAILSACEDPPEEQDK